MSNIIAQLRVALGLDSAQFTQGSKKARREAQTTAAAIKKSFAGVGKSIAGGLTAGLSVGLLAGFAKKILDYAGSLGELSAQLGVTTKDLQVFRFAAGQMGITNETLEAGLLKLTTSLGKVAAGAKAPTKALNAIGIEAKDIIGLDTGAAFRKIADGLQNIPDRAQRAAVEVALFGRSGAKLDQLLSGGSEAINELSIAAEKLGVVLSDRQIQQADETADKLEAVKTVLAAQIAGVVADNASSILSLANALASLTSSIVKFLGSNPQAALAIIGGLAGSRFGVPGAIGGAVGGALLGGRIAANGRNNSTDLSVRRAQFLKAKEEFKAANRGAADPRLGRNPAAVKARAKTLLQEMQRYRSALSAAEAQKGAASAGGGVALPQFLASGGGGKAGGAKKDNSERDRLNALRDAFQFDQDIRRNEMDILRATQDLATDYVERDNIQRRILDLNLAGEKAELDYQVAAGEISQTQADQLLKQKEITHGLEVKKLWQDQEAQRAEEAAQLAEVDFDIQRGLLETEAQLAETSREQRAVQLKILELSYRQERARLDAVLADEQSTWAAKEEARRRLAALDKMQANQRQGVINSTRGPWEAFAADASDLTDEMENLKIQGVQGVADALIAATEGWDSFKDAALSAIKQVIAELIRMQIMKMLVNMVGTAAGAPGAGMAVPVPGFAVGGFVSGPGGPTSDSIPAMLSNGEYVMNSRAVNNLGVPLLNEMNAGRIGRGDFGGAISSLGFNKSMGPFGGGAIGALMPKKIKSPFSFGLLGSILGFSKGGLVGGLPVPRSSRPALAFASPDAGGFGGGMSVSNSFHISGPVSRETQMQIAAKVRRSVADASKRNY